jgi:hypothetical protein
MFPKTSKTEVQREEIRRLMILSKEQLVDEAALLQKEIDELNKLKQYLYNN